jgi:predicted transposase YdaD
VKHAGVALSILPDVTEMDIIVVSDDTIEEGPEYKLLLWQYKQHTAQQ